MWVLLFHSAYFLLYEITSQRQPVVFTNSVCVKIRNLYTILDKKDKALTLKTKQDH